MSQGKITPPPETTTLDGISKFCMKFGHLVLRKIMKLVATRCQILRLKCTKLDFGWGYAPHPAEGVYSAPPDPVAGLRGLTSKGKGKKRGGEGKGRRKGEMPHLYTPGGTKRPGE